MTKVQQIRQHLGQVRSEASERYMLASAYLYHGKHPEASAYYHDAVHITAYADRVQALLRVLTCADKPANDSSYNLPSI